MGCGCSSDKPDIIDKNIMIEQTNIIKEKLDAVVYLLVVQNNQEIIWESDSSGPTSGGLPPDKQAIDVINAMFNGEVAISKLNDAFSSDKLRSFRLNCQHSRMLMYNVDKNDHFKLIIVYTLHDSVLLPEPPDFDDLMDDVCSKTRIALGSLLGENTSVVP